MARRLPKKQAALITISAQFNVTKELADYEATKMLVDALNIVLDGDPNFKGDERVKTLIKADRINPVEFDEEGSFYYPIEDEILKNRMEAERVLRLLDWAKLADNEVDSLEYFVDEDFDVPYKELTAYPAFVEWAVDWLKKRIEVYYNEHKRELEEETLRKEYANRAQRERDAKEALKLLKSQGYKIIAPDAPSDPMIAGKTTKTKKF